MQFSRVQSVDKELEKRGWRDIVYGRDEDRKRSSRKAEGGSRREVQNALGVDWTCETGTGGRKAEYGE